MDKLAFFSEHELATVFGAVLLEQLGAPMPAVPFLLLAGAEGVSDAGFLVRAFVAASSPRRSPTTCGTWRVAAGAGDCWDCFAAPRRHQRPA